MKRVLCNRGTQQYVKAGGTFTTNFDEAVQITSVQHALEICRSHKLRNIDLLLRTQDNAKYDVRIPIGDV